VSRLLPVLIALAATAAADAQVFRTGTRVVAVYATVQDREGRLVPDLPAEAFEIFDNGKPAEIVQFSNDPQPLTVALLLDMSGSMSSRFLMVRESTLKFVDALVPVDRVRIGTFGDEVALSPLLTSDKAVLTRVIQEEVWPGGGTPLWAAMEAGMISLEGESGRRVVLVLTDGFDFGTGWTTGFGDVRKRAIEQDFMVYAIGMAPIGLHGDAIGLTRDTGGGYITVKEDVELGPTFAQVAEELRHQYQLGFRPQVLDGRLHRIEVRLKRPNLTARARRNYLATK
jgi:Ca-activated chloride channel family protein